MNFIKFLAFHLLVQIRTVLYKILRLLVFFMFILISLIQPCVSPEAEIKVLPGIKVLILYVIKSAKLNGRYTY